MKLAILGSTKGTDAECILQSIQDGILQGITIECIISNRKNALILDKAEKYGIPSIFLSVKNVDGTTISREQYDENLNMLLTHHNIDYVLLIGWMRILSSKFVKQWENKILNIHPSLLPAYAGQMDMNVHRAVIERGCKVTGATLMFIDDGADTGPIIDQTPIKIDSTDSPEKLKEKVQKAEKELFMNYLPLLRDGKLRIVDDKVVIDNLGEHAHANTRYISY